MGHVFGDADSYIPNDMKQAAMAADPVPRFRKMILDTGVATEQELGAIEAEIERQIDEAIAFALASPWPQADDLRHDVFAEEIPA